MLAINVQWLVRSLLHIRIAPKFREVEVGPGPFILWDEPSSYFTRRQCGRGCRGWLVGWLMGVDVEERRGRGMREVGNKREKGRKGRIQEDEIRKSDENMHEE